MVKETGIVFAVKNGIARVALGREAKCSGCKHCVMASNGKYMLANALNRVDAKQGDRVVVETKDINQVKDGFLLFILPLILFFVGYALGNSFGPIVIGITAGLILGSLPFIYFKLNKRKYGMFIESVLAADGRLVVDDAFDPTEGQKNEK